MVCLGWCMRVLLILVCVWSRRCVLVFCPSFFFSLCGRCLLPPAAGSLAAASLSHLFCLPPPPSTMTGIASKVWATIVGWQTGRDADDGFTRDKYHKRITDYNCQQPTRGHQRPHSQWCQRARLQERTNACTHGTLPLRTRAACKDADAGSPRCCRRCRLCVCVRQRTSTAA